MDPFPYKDYIWKQNRSYNNSCMNVNVFGLFFFFASSVVLSPLFILTALRGHSPAHTGVDVHMGHLVQGALGCHSGA